MPKLFVCLKSLPGKLKDVEISDELLKDICSKNSECNVFKEWTPIFPPKGKPRPLDFSFQIDGFMFKLDDCMQGKLKIEVDSLFNHKDTIMGGAFSRKGGNLPSDVCVSEKLYDRVIADGFDLSIFVENLYKKLVEKRPEILAGYNASFDIRLKGVSKAERFRR